jgi:hypothetical protein
MKTKETFAEPKKSAGISMHVSTRSENIIKSSIMPWVVSSASVLGDF